MEAIFSLEQGFPEARAKPEATHRIQTVCETCESASQTRQCERRGSGSTASRLRALFCGVFEDTASNFVGRAI